MANVHTVLMQDSKCHRHLGTGTPPLPLPPPYFGVAGVLGIFAQTSKMRSPDEDAQQTMMMVIIGIAILPCLYNR